PSLSLKTGCVPSIPESSTAQRILSHFTLKSVRAASPLTDGTDRSRASIAFRFRETCQTCGGWELPFSRIGLNTLPRIVTIGSGRVSFFSASAVPSDGRFFFLSSAPAHKITPARQTYRSSELNSANSSAASVCASSLFDLAQRITAESLFFRRSP